MMNKAKSIAKNTLSILIILAVISTLSVVAFADAPAPHRSRDVSDVLDAAMSKLATTVTAPEFGTNAGEWTVLALARGGYYSKCDSYFTEYYDRIVETVNETAASVNMNGALHKNKSTENSRLIVALSAIGRDATVVGNQNLVEAYSANGFNWIKKQGINGTIWALIALDSNNYVTTDATLRQQCVDAILSAQHNDGGWALMANKSYKSDPDITGMALQALFPYRNQAAVAEACEKAFTCLSEMQHDNGIFASGGEECAESCAWVIVACTAWGIDPHTDSRFIKNGYSVVDGLLSHYLENYAQFEHIIDAGVNGMATDQACYALVAYDRFLNEMNGLFDYSDVTFTPPNSDGHTYAPTVTPPSCVDNGYTTYTCSKCDSTYTDNRVAALGHEYGSTVTPPKCTGDGYTTHTCSRCNESYTDNVVSALGHIVGDWITDTEPKIGVAGSKHRECTICGLTVDNASIDALIRNKKLEPISIGIIAIGCTVAISASGMIAWFLLRRKHKAIKKQ